MLLVYCHIPQEILTCYFGIGSPLHPLAGKNAPFIRTPQCQQEFEAVKRVFVSTPVFCHANTSKTFSVACDASNVAIGVVFFRTMMVMNSQLHNILGSLHPRSYPGPFWQRASSCSGLYYPLASPPPRSQPQVYAYKFKYEFFSSSLNILPNLLSCNPAMFPFNAEDNPQITLIPTLSVLLSTLGLLALLVLVPEFPLVLPGSLLHDVVST
ncbi:hypothetical protein DSO57_1033777 [Entomophthora muscae]|uniref:Uncharacterized protein n=1 Tax=Entomophthora muscae TaxID=34485 RepID=A0ACC2TAR9_9FUNG|nr:hypothetical protein DSO57_1033777 [Entomophthora muscae]